MNLAVGGLTVFLALYTVTGAMLLFNVWGVADKASRIDLFHRRPELWKGSGLVMLPFGIIVLIWIALQVK